MKTKEFFDALYNPPASNIKLASELDEKPRKAGMGRNVSIMCLERRGNGGYHRRDDMVWRNAGNLNEIEIENYLIFDNDFFTKKKSGLTKSEEIYLDKSWQFI